MTQCKSEMIEAGVDAVPRTCPTCKLGPCHRQRPVTTQMIERQGRIKSGTASLVDRATVAGSYVKHRMPELSREQAIDAALHALSWADENRTQ